MDAENYVNMHQDSYTRMFTAALFIISPNWGLPNFYGIRKKKNTRTTEYYKAIKINKLLHATT